MIQASLLCPDCHSPLASAETVVIVRQKNPATRMFSEQASQFFLATVVRKAPLTDRKRSKK